MWKLAVAFLLWSCLWTNETLYGGEQLTLELESRQVTSTSFELRLFVDGFQEDRMWQPALKSRVQWDESALLLAEAELAPSLSGSNPFLIVVEVDHTFGDVVIELLCDFCVPVVVEERQPVVVLTFVVQSDFSSTDLTLKSELPTLGNRSVVLSQDASEWIEPVLVNGRVAVRRFVRGDSNSDGEVDVSDALYTFNYLFAGGPPPGCGDFADTNDDARVDISDGIGLLNHLFAGGASPPAPFPEAGLDGTPDDLECVQAWPEE